MATAGSKQGGGSCCKPPPAAGRADDFDPRYEWLDDGDGCMLRMELGGFTKQDVRVEVNDDGRLTVRGRRSNARTNPMHSRFSKVFQLPSTSNLDVITGRLDAGVLTLTMPKLLPVPAKQQQQVQDHVAAKQQAEAPPARDAKPLPQQDQDQSEAKEDEEIMSIVQEAQKVPKPARPISRYGRGDASDDKDNDQYEEEAEAEAETETEQEEEEEEAEQVEMENIHMEFDSLESILGGRESPRNLKLPFLKFITKKFSDELIIGIGGCGVVYKGILPNQNIAVKRLLNSHTIEDKMFHREVKSMIMVSHKNVVRFLGYCSHTEEHALKMEGEVILAQYRERLLCFEYLINGSLQSYLTDELRGLEWQTRYQIIRGICDGLHHLHSEKHIIHMDLKPANILLDSNMVPKITDFGISRLGNVSQTTSSQRLVSLGYCAPEYQHHGKFSAKSDIYSIGVIILELVTGSKVEPDITKVHRRWKHRWNKTAKDAQLGYKQVATCLHLAERCMQMNPIYRPNIWDIINCLNEMDSSNAETSDGSESLDLDDMLGVEPLEIHLPFKPNTQISCSVELTNDTDDHFAFRISNASLRPYCIEAYEGTVPPRSKCSVTISLQALDKALPVHQCRDEFCVESTRVDGSLAAMNIGSGDIFIEEPGKVIDTVDFCVVLSEAASPSANH